jgi:NADH-quinone oxidoreductase subunit C
MNELPELLKNTFLEIAGLEITPQTRRRIRLDLDSNTLPALLSLLKGRASYLHLSAISCVDWDKENKFELVYHLWSYEVKTLISAHIFIDKKTKNRYISVYDIHMQAGFFERDIHEMFGIYFEGSPNMKPFILTEWQGIPPMLKSFSTEKYVNDTYQWQDYKTDWL